MSLRKINLLTLIPIFRTHPNNKQPRFLCTQPRVWNSHSSETSTDSMHEASVILAIASGHSPWRVARPCSHNSAVCFCYTNSNPWFFVVSQLPTKLEIQRQHNDRKHENFGGLRYKSRKGNLKNHDYTLLKRDWLDDSLSIFHRHMQNPSPSARSLLGRVCREKSGIAREGGRRTSRKGSYEPLQL
jgi:hypothetical protein